MQQLLEREGVFDRKRVIAPTFNGGVVDHNNTFLAFHTAYAGNDASTGHIFWVNI